MRVFVVVTACVAVVSGMPAHATNVAKALNRDGTQIMLTDQTLMECTQLGYSAVGYIMRPGKSEQPLCYGVDWDARVVTMLPLIQRSQSKRIWGSIGNALTGASPRVQQRANSLYDYGDKFTVPSDAFAWTTTESQGWLPATPP